MVGRSLGRIVEGELVLQTPEKNAAGERSKQESPNATRLPIWSPELQNPPRFYGLREKHEALRTDRKRSAMLNMFVAHLIAGVAQIFFIYDKPDTCIGANWTELKFRG
jgi:hypothetical protein